MLVIQLAVSRIKRRKEKSASLAMWSGWSVSAALSLGTALLLIWISFAYRQLTAGLPSLELLPLLFDAPNGMLLQPTRLYDRNAEHIILTLESPAVVSRKPLQIEGQSNGHLKALINATLASVEPDFWQSPGYSLSGILEGTHPTLAQKLAVEFLLQNESSGLRRNLRERLLASQMIQRFGREKILEWYLNTAHYGPYIYGVEAASQAFFNKSAIELTLAEAALLAATAEAPGIHPYEATQPVMERQRQILQKMFILGWISSDELAQASRSEIQIQAPAPLENASPAFTDLVLKQLSTAIPEEEVIRGGYRIITTLDYNLQMQSQCSTQALLNRLSGKKDSVSGADCPTARLLPTLTTIQGDIPLGSLEAMLVALDPKTGQILSMVGSDRPGLNPSRLPGYSPGTLLSPVVYLSAFSRGFSPGSMLWDIPSRAGLSDHENRPNDYHGPVRLRTALVNDYIGVVKQLFDQLGQENIIRTARQLGINSLDLVNPGAGSLTGFSEWVENRQITLLEAVQAYGIFANQGIVAGWSNSDSSSNNSPIQAATILRVENSFGQLLLDWSQPQSRPVISRSLAFLMTHVLSDETARWPSLGHPNPLEIGRPAAAKIGITSSQTIEWTVGYTPQIVIGTWIGPAGNAGYPAPLHSSAALWHAEMQYALRNLPTENWEVPPGVRFVEVCDPSGLLPTPDCPSVVSEVFLSGLEPVQEDNLYQKVEINRETGKRATIFTPSELITERVYLIIPAEAAEWAKQSGLPLPPEDFDTIYAPEELNPNAQITEPAIFSHVHGQVIFRGKARGLGFQFYRLQVGQGLNPREWMQIGPDVPTAVEDGILGTWNTQGLSGLYTIQLWVVRTDQRVDRAVTQVTIDNEPPEVKILEPDANRAISKEAQLQLIRAEAADNLELDRVEFYLDNRLVVVLNEPPFVYPWKPTAGKHTLQITATDLAGNQSEAVLELTVR